MAINLARATRKLDFSCTGGTDQQVGPGSYSNTHNEVRQPLGEAPVPFLSLQERNLNANIGTSAITPGPGTYRCNPSSLSDHCPTSLKSGVRRLGPTAPGSTVFTASTVEKNPGPGTYSEARRSDLGRPLDKPLMAATRPVLEAMEKSTPSMPLMKLKPGQRPENESDNDVANFVMRHTGDGKDSAGPGEYDPVKGYQMVLRQQPQTCFFASKKERTLFDYNSAEARIPPRDVPGPGAYEQPGVFSARRDFQEEIPNSYQFKSSSLLTYQMEAAVDKVAPGPGTYESASGIDGTVKSARHRRAASGESVQFGSSTGRDCLLMRSARTPYTDPYHLHHVPGPGHYPADSFSEDPKKKEAEKVLLSSRRKKIHGVHHPSIIIALAEAQGPLQAFNSTDDRPCNKVSEQDGPPPWHYNRETARGQSMGAELRERAKVGRRGAFGTCTDRFFRSPLNGKQGLPDPNGAEGFEATGGHSTAYAEPKSAFQSQTPRFNVAAGPREEQVVKVGNIDTPAPGQYDVCKEPNYRSQFRAPRVEHLSFGSAKNRFEGKDNVFAEQVKVGMDNPGPGVYDAKPWKKHIHGVHPGKSARAGVIVGCTSHEVGPGSYGGIETHMLKKTFNVSTQAPVNANGSEMASARSR